MDGGGRLDRSVTRSGPNGVEGAGTPLDEPSRPRALAPWPIRRRTFRSRWPAAARGTFVGTALRLLFAPPPGAGIAGSAVLIAAAVVYGVIAGQHVQEIAERFKDVRDSAADATGFRIRAIALTGSKEVSREEILTTAGVTGRSSLLFLDADGARSRLLANPWIADASVLKLYPDRLQIAVTERRAFALWQKDGLVNVIATDGTVLEPFTVGRYSGLPLVVGRGAQRAASEFLAVIDRYPEVRAMLRASILVAERRWDLRLANGVNVRLPETDVAGALDRLVELDRDRKLLSRDITAVDLRLADRVTVRLSDAAAQAHDEALQSKKKKKGGDA